MSDSEQCSNRLQLYLILILINSSCELGQIMTRYNFLKARWMILSNVQTDSNLTGFNFGQLFIWIWANNDQTNFIEARWVILSNVLTFGTFSLSRKPIINGGAVWPVGLLLGFVIYIWYLIFLGVKYLIFDFFWVKYLIFDFFRGVWYLLF